MEQELSINPSNCERYILIKNKDGGIQYDDKGWLMLMDTLEEQIHCVEPSQEVLELYGFTVISEGQEKPSTSTTTKTMRNSKWTRPSTLSLIHAYKEAYSAFKNTTKKNNTVWEELTNTLNQQGYEFSKEQVKSKFKYLKEQYMKKKDNIGRKGTGEPPFSFDYFDEMEEIFGEKDNAAPLAIASSLNGNIPRADNSDKESNASSSSCPQPAKKTKLDQELQLRSLMDTRDEKREEAKERRHKELQTVRKDAITAFKHRQLEFELIC